MTYEETMSALEALGNPNTKKVLMKHGAQEPFWGVKVGDMKKLMKKVKNDHELALQLYDSGNGDAMYFAALIDDKNQVTPDQLRDWAEKSTWYMTSEYSVAWLAADSGHAVDLGKEWIESDKEMIAVAGWSALSNHISITANEELDIPYYESLITRVEKEIDHAPNRVRYVMNGYLLCVGSYIPELSDKAVKAAQRIGKVEVNMGDTACKVPDVTSYVAKIKDKGRIGVKRKMARC